MWGYLGEVAKPEGYETYVKRLIYGVKNWEEYLKERKAMKGENYFNNLRIQPIASEPVYTGFEPLKPKSLMV
jgi:hypothetical protein